ncbi:cytochrome C oxidase subunit IV family protein [Undibacterium sp.]|uniref:cytochrome C oxidase subunit IV family protein n=1 Tax=Undibacterium sp. TaxID=1914977 RepID=UPI0025FCF2CA|nr:cytochrome C oxidase subunit IV family protein [Undibacterium sp.]
MLLVLSTLSFGLAETDYLGKNILLPVLLATLIKGSIVIDKFMALRHVAGPWRLIVMTWLLVVLGTIWFSYTRI